MSIDYTVDIREYEPTAVTYEAAYPVGRSPLWRAL
jgi:hypothetical protein